MFTNRQVLSRVLKCLIFGLFAIVVFQLATGLRQSNTESQPPLLVGINVWPGYEPLFLARDLGHYDDRSLRLVEYSSASQVINEFRNNAIQVAAVTLDEALLLKERGVEFRVILVTDISHGGDAIVAKSDVKTLTDLRGRSVGVEHTALGAYVLTRAIQTVDMSIADVKIVPLQVDEHEQAFADGRIDAVVTFEPVRSRLLAQGAVQLFDSSLIPGEIVDVLIIRADALEQYKSQVDIILTGWFEALAYLREHPQDASRRMSVRLRLLPDEVLLAYQGLRLISLDENVSMLDGNPAKLMTTAHQLGRVMKEEKLLESEVLFDDCVSVEALKRLLTE